MPEPTTVEEAWEQFCDYHNYYSDDAPDNMGAAFSAGVTAGRAEHQQQVEALVEAARAMPPCDVYSGTVWCHTHSERFPCVGEELRAALQPFLKGDER